MKKNIISLVASAITLTTVLLVSSCNNKEPKKNDFGTTEAADPQNTDGQLRASDVADAVANGGLNLADFESIAYLIEQNVAKGYDERLYLEDIPTDENSLRSATGGFLQKIANYMSERNTIDLRSTGTEGSSTNPIEKFVGANMSVYWPYITEWNRKRLPVIAYVDENTPKDAETIEALKIDEHGKVIGRLIIDEAYAEKNPVMIVSKKVKSPYSILKTRPANYFSPFDISKLPVKYEPEKVLLSLYLGKIRLLKQFDPWLAGGSEICVRVAYTYPERNPNTGEITLVPKNGHVNVNFTRKEIKEKVAKTFDTMLVSEWKQGMELVYVKMLEDDSWFGRTMDFSASFTHKGLKIDVSFKIPNSYDDIFGNYFSIAFLMSDRNVNKDNTPVWHNGGNVEWTFPIKKGVL